MSGAECWKDHHLIMTKLHIKVPHPQRLRKSTKKQLNCAKLKSAPARNMFHHSVGMKAPEFKTILCSDNTMDQKWTSRTSVLYIVAVDSLGYKTRKHQDRFNENFNTIISLLEIMCRAHRATLNCPASTILRQQWQTSSKEVQTTLCTLQIHGG